MEISNEIFIHRCIHICMHFKCNLYMAHNCVTKSLKRGINDCHLLTDEVEDCLAFKLTVFFVAISVFEKTTFRTNCAVSFENIKPFLKIQLEKETDVFLINKLQALISKARKRFSCDSVVT